MRDLAVMLADGGDCLTDLGAPRDQGVLFDEAASDPTADRCVERLDAGMLAQMRNARAAARARAGVSQTHPGGWSWVERGAELTVALPAVRECRP